MIMMKKVHQISLRVRQFCKQNLKIWFLILGVLLVVGLGASLFQNFNAKNHENIQYLAVIPHFMIKSQRVSDFYAFLQKKYFSNFMPDQIVLISPNHFFPNMQNPVSICTPRSVKFNATRIFAQGRKESHIICDQNVFYQKGNQRYTKDHGLGVHFPFLNHYFPSVSKIWILVMPSYRLYHSAWLADDISHIPGKTLVIGSVDFSHYKSEDIAVKNDRISFTTLSQTGSFDRLKKLDVDCPACLGVVDNLAQRQWKHLQQRLRDSSSTILGKNMYKENTSRQFLWRE